MEQLNLVEAFQLICKNQSKYGIYLDIDINNSKQLEQIDEVVKLNCQIIADKIGILLFDNEEQMMNLYHKLDQNRIIRRLTYALTCNNKGQLERENT